jgi:CheY-like chemotaxis protein
VKSSDTAPLDPTRLAGVRVLVVEDDADSREMLCELLSHLGAKCETAPDVATAREKLSMEGWVPDVVISDIGLPDEDGYALSRWVRGRPSPLPPPPLIAFTGTADREATLRAGFVAHVPKPVDIAKIVEAIEAVLAKKSVSERQPP